MAYRLGVQAATQVNDDRPGTARMSGARPRVRASSR